MRSGNICCQSLKLSEIAPNFACSWPLEFFEGGKKEGPLEMLDEHYKTKHTFHYVWQFRGDRPTDLGDIVAQKKKENKRQQNASPPGN